MHPLIRVLLCAVLLVFDFFFCIFREFKSMANQHSLSNLPEKTIINILSLMDTKEAVKTSVLSKQWRYYWTHIHTLNFNFLDDLTPYDSYDLFVTDVLHHRQNIKLWQNIKLSKLNIKLAVADPPIDEWKQELLILALDYAISHQMEEFELNSNTYRVRDPYSLFDILDELCKYFRD